MVFFEKDNLRLNSIAYVKGISEDGELDIEERRAREGLAIESKQEDGTYLVIVFLNYDKDEKEVQIQGVGKRILDLEDSVFPVFKELCWLGASIVESLNKEAEENE